MTFSREARINGVASPLFNVFVCLHLATHHAAVALALAQTAGPSVRQGRPLPAPSKPKPKDSGMFRNQSRAMCTRGVSRLPRGSNFAQTGRRLDKKDAEGTLELDPGFLVPPPACCLPWICHYIMTFFSYYRRPAESGGLAYLHPSNLNVTRVSLTCFPRATCTMRPRGVGQNRHRVVLCYRHSVCPDSTELTTRHALHRQESSLRPQDREIGADVGPLYLYCLYGGLPGHRESIALFSHSSFLTLALVGGTSMSWQSCVH